MTELQINCENSDSINVFFSMVELKKAINQGKDASPGRDGLGYQLFKNCGEMIEEEALALINNKTGEWTSS